MSVIDGPNGASVNYRPTIYLQIWETLSTILDILQANKIRKIHRVKLQNSLIKV